MPRLQVPLNLDELREEVDQWYALRRQAKLLEAEIERRKKQLKATLEKYGEKDERGSLFLDLGEPVGDANITELKNQIAVSDGMNPEAVEEVLKAKHLWDEMTYTVREVDQARVKAAYYDKRITLDELSRMFPQRVTYSFILLDGDGKPIR